MTETSDAAPNANMLSVKLAGLAPAGAQPKARDVLNALGEPGFGVLAILLGLVLLVPVRWVLPQLAGLLLLVNALRLWRGKPAAAPFAGGAPVPAAALAKGFSWIENVARPRLAQLAVDFAGPIAAFALLMAGVAAFVPAPHLLVSLGLIVLGAGLAERDGAFTAAGVALCICAGFYALTMLAGLGLGASFAQGWAGQHLPELAVSRADAPRP